MDLPRTERVQGRGLKTTLTGRVKGWLEQGALPDDPELAQDLTGVEYGYDAKNAIQIERKEDMKRRGLLSPDIGDALALTFAWPLQPEVDYRWHDPPRVRILDKDHDYDPFHDI
ncbi:MAG: hypothetical protein K2Y40_02455 [Reyranella sp.]|nr:hypothetical protein [Reyranella sp.]